tara:strand:- start:44475 stop:45083 length:609 start_codon:yes stop_codon:yes gene_type:complete
MEFIKENFLWIVITASLIVLVLNYKWTQFKKTRLRKKRFARGAKMEEKAALVLKRKGFDVDASQAVFYHDYKANGIDKRAKLEVDYVVSKNGKTYLIEVKSGAVATQIENKATRRQILEYSVAIENDGVYLLDMETESLQKIEFKIKMDKANMSVYFKVAILMLVCGSAAAPDWNAKSIFIGIAVVFLTFSNTVNRLFLKLK